MRIGVMCAEARRLDPVGNDAISMCFALKKAGHDVFFFTHDGQSEYPFESWNYHDTTWLMGAEDVLIYHHSRYDPLALHVLNKVVAQIILRFHNPTPGRFSLGYADDLAKSARGGRAEIGRLLDLPILGCIPSSAFGQKSLTQAGYPAGRCHMVPLLHSGMRIDEPIEPATAAHLNRTGFNIVAVGNIAPESGYGEMIEALALAAEAGLPRVSLQILGASPEGMAGYKHELDTRIAALGLSDWVFFHTSFSASALATYYRSAEFFWSSSLYDGFRMPIAEALSFGLPVLSTRTASAPELGGEAILYADTVSEMAERITDLVTNDDLRAALSKRSLKRARAFQMDSLVERLLAAIQDIRRPGTDTAEDLDWFGLPDEETIAALCRTSEADLVTAGHRRMALFRLFTSPNPASAVVAYLHGEELKTYAEALVMPRLGEHLSPAAKLIWRLSTFAQAAFPLDRPEEVGAFWSWYMRAASPALSPLMSPYEARKKTLTKESLPELETSTKH